MNDSLKTATEIWYKAQRVLRTVIAVIIPAFLGFALLLPQLIDALGLPDDSTLRIWLLGIAAGVTAVAAALTRIMAIPAVNAWLTKIGLGSVPKKAVVRDVVTATGEEIGARVLPDPKVDGRG